MLPRPPFPGHFLYQNEYDPKPVGRVQLPSEDVWYTFSAETSWPPTYVRLWRSADAGRHWQRVAVPAGTSVVAFPSPLVGYAAARPRGRRTPEQLWKTLDGGRSWVPLPGTCGPDYTSLDFLDTQHGFASESQTEEFDMYAYHVVVRATSDGGRQWSTRYRAGRWWQTYTRLFFADELRGWAVSSEWDQGFEHDSVHVTADGGRKWQPVTYPALPEGFLGGSAWTGPWRTANWGRSWQLDTRPDQVSPLRLLIATGRRLDIETGIGAIESRDGGRTWRTRPQLTALEVARATHARAYVQPARDQEGSVAYLRSRRGWRPLVPGRFFGPGAVAFRDTRHGLVASGQLLEDDIRPPVYRTRDGGRTWAKVRLPAGVVDDPQLLVARDVIVIPNAVYPSRRLVIMITVDDGLHWRRTTIDGRSNDCGLSRFAASIWILCSPYGRGRTVLLRSSDGGAHWIRRRGLALLDPHLIATGPRNAWTIGVPDWRRQTGAPLLRTVDGGRTWREVWPRLGPGNLAYDLGR